MKNTRVSKKRFRASIDQTPLNATQQLIEAQVVAYYTMKKAPESSVGRYNPMPVSSQLAPFRATKVNRHLRTSASWTDKELLALPDGGKYELVDGALEHMPPAKPQHGRCASRLMIELGSFVMRNTLGECYDGQTGFRMASGNMRSPDISFIPHERVKVLELERKNNAFFRGAPDLAVEVLSPSDRPKRIAGKLADYFENGARLVWLIDPVKKSARVYRDAKGFTELGVDESLDGEDVVRGFKLPLAKLFN